MVVCDANKGTMAKNGNVIMFTGHAKIIPSKERTPNQSKHSEKSHTRVRHSEKSHTRVRHSEKSHTTISRTDYKDKVVSIRCTDTRKSGDYVTRSDSVGYKEEKRTKSTVKVTHKVQGITIEHQTRVKVEEVVHVHRTTKKSPSSKSIK